MNKSAIKIRLMKADDFDAVVKIDEKILKTSRPEYYEVKFEKLHKTKTICQCCLWRRKMTEQWRDL
jgi:hypothetical protein